MAQTHRKRVVGVVRSAKMAKTIVVDVARLVKHPKFGKYLRKTSTFYAHDEKRQAQAGDRVEIISTRPLSKLKRWSLVRIVKKSPVIHIDAQAGLTTPTNAPGTDNPGGPGKRTPPAAPEATAKAAQS
ncbi:MAG: 30S ribosomal protein S17 [Planctomycetes bacterium]|nr:30S ribosomal protein S17 [Planctomycetota bacterium]